MHRTVKQIDALREIEEIGQKVKKGRNKLGNVPIIVTIPACSTPFSYHAIAKT